MNPVPVKYVSKKINGALMWVPVYKKGEGPSVPTARSKKKQPVPEKKVEVKKNHVPPGFLKRYAEEHKEAKKGILVNGICRICNEPFEYTKSKASMPRKLCSAVCAYQAQKDFNKAYEVRKKAIAANKDTKLVVKKSFVDRVAEHLPPTLPPPEMKETIAPARPVSQPPSWEILVEEASNMGIDLDKEPPRAQNFFVSLLMARRAHHFDEWKKLLKSQNVRIRQLPETYLALKSVSGEGAIGAARALKTRMGM